MIAIYARQSKDKKDSLSIDSQVTDCINLCALKGRNDYKIYHDKGWSAKNLNRPGFQALNNDVKRGMIDMVCCYRIDRVSRSIRDLVNLIADYQELGAHFVSVSDRIDTGAPGGLMLATLFGSMAQMEREGIIARVTDNYYYRCNLGFWGGGPAPYGYRLGRTKYDGKMHSVLEQDPDEADIVRDIFGLYLEPDATVPSVLAKLHNRGIKTRRGADWTSRVLTDLLFHPLYAPNTIDIYNYFKLLGCKMEVSPEDCDGTMSVNLYGRLPGGSKHKRSRNPKDMTFSLLRHEAIIDADTYLAVRAKRKSMEFNQSPRSGTSLYSPYSGLVFCGTCGHAMSPNGGADYKYYCCSAKRNYAGGTCSQRGIGMKKLDAKLTASLLEHVHKIERENLPHLTIAYDPSVRQQLNDLKVSLAEADEAIEKLIDSIVGASDITAGYLNKRIEALDAERKSLSLQIVNIEDAHRIRTRQYEDADLAHADELFEGNDISRQHTFAKLLIKKIIYHSPESIEITYNF